jgi:hypothetical protein
MRGPSLPTQRADVARMVRTTRLVVGTPLYGAVAVLVTLVALTVAVAVQNWALVSDVVLGSGVSLGARVGVLFGLYPFVGTAYTAVQGALVVTATALLGVDLALLAYQLREHGVAGKESAGGVGGAVLASLGAGCAACGSAVLAGILSAVGAAGVLALLPLDGLEFAIVAIAMLLVSIHWIADGMRGGEIRGCRID